jgi:hypothetical protein
MVPFGSGKLAGDVGENGRIPGTHAPAEPSGDTAKASKALLENSAATPARRRRLVHLILTRMQSQFRAMYEVNQLFRGSHAGRLP